MSDRNFRKVKNISKDLQETYVKYFHRNTSKFFSKWRFSDEDLNKIFLKENEEYELKGQVNETTFLFHKLSEDTLWFVHGDIIRDEFSKK